MKNDLLKQAFAKAGRPIHTDNRSFFHRSVNSILDKGLVQIEICEPGKVWKIEGMQYNIKAIAFDRIQVMYKKSFDAADILKCIGLLLQDSIVRERILSNVYLPDKCETCSGSGHLPMYHYYCNGICFQCYGTGLSIQKMHVEIIAEK